VYRSQPRQSAAADFNADRLRDSGTQEAAVGKPSFAAALVEGAERDAGGRLTAIHADLANAWPTKGEMEVERGGAPIGRRLPMRLLP
jgi:hypothetical protein